LSQKRQWKKWRNYLGENSGNGTTIEKKAEILADLWMNYRGDDEFQDFISYNDLGLPLAYLITQDLVKPQKVGITLLEETFDLLLASMELPEDEGFDSLDDLFSI
jgi:hypothetical protein